jgi:hypothetical protein
MFWRRTLGVTGSGGGNVGRVTLLFFNGHGHSRVQETIDGIQK